MLTMIEHAISVNQSECYIKSLLSVFPTVLISFELTLFQVHYKQIPYFHPATKTE